MKLYNSQIIDNILENLDKENKTIITQINWKSIKSFDFKNNILNLAKNFSGFWVKKDETVVIFVRNNILFSNIIISSILAWLRISLLDPAMWKQIITEKIKASNTTYLLIDWIIYDYLFLTNSEILKLDLKVIINWFTIFWNRHKKLKKLLIQNNSVFKYEKNNENSDCIIVFTGWTTWNPKWVVHSLASIYNTLNKIKDFCKNTKVFYADMPHFLLLWILINAKVISWPYNIKPKKLKSIIEKFNIDTYFSPPYKYNYFIENNLKVPKSLNNILLWSAPIYKWFLEKLIKLCYEEQKITCVYWMTEILPISYIDLREKVNSKIEWDLLWYFLEWIDYKIIENELLVKWNHSLKKYLWYEIEDYIKTWDLVKIVDSKLVMIWRKKDMIIKKEYNIYPQIFEPIISKIPWVLACAMVGIYDEKLNDENIILYLELSNNYKYSEKEIYNFLNWKYQIDKYAIPDKIIFMKLPVIWRQNKVDKNKLREFISIKKS